MAAQVAAINKESSVEDTIVALSTLVQMFLDYKTQNFYPGSREYGCHRSQCEFGCNCESTNKRTYSELKWNYTTIEELFREEITNPEIIVKILAQCKCCERHQIDRPIKLHLWEETDYKNRDPSDGDCKCVCRHLSRFLCRSCPYNSHKYQIY